MNKNLKLKSQYLNLHNVLYYTIMYSFITAFDDYVQNKQIFEYTTVEGNLRFVKDDKKIIIDVIYVKECFRQKGILKKLLQHVVSYINKSENIEFMIISVLSKILYNYLLRFDYNGYKFKLMHSGFLLKEN